MQEALDSVKEFLKKNNLPVDLRLHESLTSVDDDRATNLLDLTSHALMIASTRLERAYSELKEPRLLRAHLMTEELAEALNALAERDEIELLDGLCDLLYVALGTAAAYDLPVVEGLLEVCRSNLTKAPRQDGDPRLRNKGADYSPPDLQRVLADHRNAGMDRDGDLPPRP
jgi:hypothetical protein